MGLDTCSGPVPRGAADQVVRGLRAGRCTLDLLYNLGKCVPGTPIGGPGLAGAGGRTTHCDAKCAHPGRHRDGSIRDALLDVAAAGIFLSPTPINPLACLSSR